MGNGLIPAVGRGHVAEPAVDFTRTFASDFFLRTGFAPLDERCWLAIPSFPGGILAGERNPA